MKVSIGSKNPVKVNAVKRAFSKLMPNDTFEFAGIDVLSGVSSQPLSDIESIAGARNRAKAALAAGRADFGVGLEHGMQQVEGQWFNGGWVVVVSRTGVEGIGATIKMQVPPKMAALIQSGKELSEIDDRMFGAQNSGRQGGFFGLMTNDVLTREQAYDQALAAALSRFLQPQLFE